MLLALKSTKSKRKLNNLVKLVHLEDIIAFFTKNHTLFGFVKNS